MFFWFGSSECNLNTQPNGTAMSPVMMNYDHLQHNYADLFCPHFSNPTFWADGFENFENLNKKRASPQAALIEEQTHEKSKKVERNWELLKVNRNLKSIILNDFIKSIKKDASSVLIIKSLSNMDYPIKQFIDCLYKVIPKQGKYIRVKTIEKVCLDAQKPEFAKIFRILLQYYLKYQCQFYILSKKKNKIDYLRACRQIHEKLFAFQN